jgi:peroxiredoxin
MRIKRIVLLGLVFLAALQQTVLGYEIKGQINNLGNAKVYLLVPGGDDFVAVDSTLTNAGAFVLKGKIKAPTIARLRVEGHPFPLIYFMLENTNYEVKSMVTEKARLVIPEITGGPLQAAWNDYNKAYQQIYEVRRTAGQRLYQLKKNGTTPADTLQQLEDLIVKTEQRETAFTKDAIFKNKANALGTYLMSAHLLSYEYNEARAAVARFVPELKNDFYYKNVVARLDKVSNVLNGKPAPAFQLKDTLGNAISLHDFKGKWVVLDFWASWCAPCRAENPDLLKLYEEVKAADIVFLGISLDHDKAAWKKAIQQDGLTWQHASDLKGWKSAMCEKYAVEGVPHKFLIDPKGNIVLSGAGLSDIKSALQQR